MIEEEGDPKLEFASPTFAIKKGDVIYVTVAVLEYRMTGNKAQDAGFEQMKSDFDRAALEATYESVPLQSGWYMMSPMNSSPEGLSEDDKDDD